MPEQVINKKKGDKEQTIFNISIGIGLIAIICLITAAIQCGHSDGGVEGYKTPESYCVPLIVSGCSIALLALVLCGCVARTCAD
tara:strand:- start:186 stop:437 length:252 start_codon:yes stop_codon:yes gene_type:complete